MTAAVQPVIMTADLNRLLAFYTELLGATQTSRVPDEGPAFYVGLGVGNSELGLVADAEGAAGAVGRILLSVAVPDVEQHAMGTASGAHRRSRWQRRQPHPAHLT